MTNQPWANNYSVPLLILSGPADSGKTTFALFIDPKPAGEEPNHLLFDFEKGSVNAERMFAVKRIDPQNLVTESANQRKRNQQLYEAWWKIADEETQAHDYSVLTIDPGDVLYKGAFEHVCANPAKFGLKPALLAKDQRTAWGEARVLLANQINILMSRVGTIVVIAHQRNKFTPGNDYGPKEKEARIAETWVELATLHLHLYRGSDKIKIRNVEYDACPSYPLPMGIVLKARHLDRVDLKTSKITPLLPARMPVCTPAKLKEFMLKPVKLTDENQMPDVVPGVEEVMSETEQQAAALELAREADRMAIQTEKNALYTELVLTTHRFADQVEMAAFIKGLGFENYEEMRAKLGSVAAQAKETWFPVKYFKPGEGTEMAQVTKEEHDQLAAEIEHADLP